MELIGFPLLAAALLIMGAGAGIRAFIGSAR